MFEKNNPVIWFELPVMDMSRARKFYETVFGISLAPAGQGRGYAGEAARALFDHVFGPLGRHRIHASVDPRNLACLALLRSLGMRQEAHHRESLWLHGEWVDDMVFVMLSRDWAPPDLEVESEEEETPEEGAAPEGEAG